jgi:parallel beta-helix repeat protein
MILALLSWGSNNTLDQNEAYDGTEGFIVGGESHHLTNNTADNNDWSGFFVSSIAQNAVLSGNTATGNGIWGFEVYGDYTHLKKNQASKNQHGIFSGLGTTNNVFTSNTAKDNTTWDLEDSLPSCGTNSWKKNTFGTASQPCIH